MRAKRRLQIVIVLVLVLGLILRLTNVAHKVYGHNEVLTSMRVVGYTIPEIESTVLAGPVVTAAQLQQFQQLSPARSWGDALTALSTQPEYPPLFYFLERAWVSVVGASPVALRLLSVLLSVAALPLMYWLGRVLLRDDWAAGLAMALLAVSPVQMLYAQEAREYSLWGCTILLSSGLLLRALQRTGDSAIRRQYTQAGWQRSGEAWALYGLSVVLGLYTTLLTVWVVVAQGLYVLLVGSRRHWARFGVSLMGAIALFSPWLWVMVQHRETGLSVTVWTQLTQPLGALMRHWGLHLSSTVVDFDLPATHGFALGVPLLVLLGVAIALLTMPVQVGLPATLFCGVLLLIPALGLIGAELLLGGERSMVTGSFMPSLLMVLPILAVGLRGWLLSRRARLRLWGQGLLALLLVASLSSGLLSASRFTWWNKGVSYHVPVIAEVIRTAEQPLVLSALTDTGLGNAISLSYQVPDETPFLFFRPNLPPPLPTDYSDYWVPYASSDVIESLEKAYGRSVTPVQAPGVYELWRLGPAAASA